MPKTKKADAYGVKIHLPDDEVWDFYIGNVRRLEKEMVLIAENKETDYSVYITDEDGMPLVAAYKGDKEEYSEKCITPTDCRETVKDIIRRYLLPLSIAAKQIKEEEKEKTIDGYLIPDEIEDYLKSKKDSSAQTLEDKAYVREDKLWLAFTDFMSVVLAEDAGLIEEGTIEEELKDIYECVLEYIGYHHGLPVYRPTITENEYGDMVFTEYPYEENCAVKSAG